MVLFYQDSNRRRRVGRYSNVLLILLHGTWLAMVFFMAAREEKIDKMLREFHHFYTSGYVMYYWKINVAMNILHIWYY